MKKKFIGNVKPFFKVEGLNLEIAYEEEFVLEEWQIKHPHFIFARKNGWVISSDARAFLLNSEIAKKNGSKVNYKKWTYDAPIQAVSHMPMNVAAGVDEKTLKQILDNQVFLISNVQNSYNSLKDKVTQPVKVDVNTAKLESTIAQMQEQQRVILDLLSKKDEDKNSEILAALLNEIKNINNSKNAQPQITATPPADIESAKIIEMLEQMNKLLASKSGSSSRTSSYNNETEEKQSNIEDFEERYVPKVEDFSVKNSNIVTQKSSSGSVDDAVAALKALKKQKGL